MNTLQQFHMVVIKQALPAGIPGCLFQSKTAEMQVHMYTAIHYITLNFVNELKRFAGLKSYFIYKVLLSNYFSGYCSLKTLHSHHTTTLVT